MNKTKIPWADYTINPVKGKCPVACSYCYARRMYDRFKWNPEIRFEPLDYKKYPAGCKVFVGSTMELFGNWIKVSWLEQIFEWCRRLPDVTFIFLTKRPENLARWSPFPENCWVGVSVSNDKMLDIAVDKLEDIQANTKFLSLEPLLEKLTLSLDYAFYYSGIKWLIIGSQTQPTRHPNPEWVKEIITAADAANIPIFVKEPLASYMNIHRQEYPH